MKEKFFMNNKLNREILNLAKKIKADAKQIRGENENKIVEDIKYIESAIDINGEKKNIICMVLRKGENALSYRYYIDNKLVAVVDDDVRGENNLPNLVILNKSLKDLDIDGERLRKLIRNPKIYEAEELSALVEFEKNEKLVEKLAAKLGVSKDEIKGIGLLNAEQKVKEKEEDKKDSDKQEIEQPEEQIVFADDINVKQNLDVDVKVDEMKTLGQTLKVSSKCENIAVIETYQLDEVDENARGNTRYAFAAINDDGTIELLEGLEEDHSVGSNSTQETYKIEHDGNVEENTVLSRYTINGTDATLSVRNGKMGQIEVFYSPAKSKSGNESLDKQLQTDNVLWRTSTEMRDVVGYYDKDGDSYKVDNAIERAEQINISDDDNTEYRDLDNDAETISDNEQDIELDTPIYLEDGSSTTIRDEAEKAKVSPEEFLSKYENASGETPEDKIENVHEEIENEYGGGGRDRKR